MYKKILVAIDGSEFSLTGGEIALNLSERFGSGVLAAHVYDGKIHSHRLREMEPDLPEQYQEEAHLRHIRDSHNELIYDGFKALSKGYIEDFEKRAEEKKIEIEHVYREGKNYSGILEILEERQPGLVILGAWGLGFWSESMIGSTAVRVLRMAGCDVLIARRKMSSERILVGLDGSGEALNALDKSVSWAKALNKPLHIASAYDPFFHGKIFNTMATALSSERQQDVGLNNQQSLHDNLIDEGLGKLYQRFLEIGAKQALQGGITPETSLLKGKTIEQIVNLSVKTDPDLIVMGRYGHHRNDKAQVGSNSEAIVRMAKTNILVTEPE
ncbi:universal stress family protein [delta proteobacterium NaphS2]|nr:universal stress family protein [delta proteobacterium NaphS2]